MSTRKGNRWRFAKWIVVILGVSALGWGGQLYFKSKQTKQVWTLLQKRIVKVERRDLKRELVLSGKIIPASSVPVYSPQTGQVEQIFVQEGQAVKKGQSLFSVQPDSSGQQGLEVARAEVNRARVELRSAEDQLNRRKGVEDLFSLADNEKAQVELDRQQVAYATAVEKLRLLSETLGIKEDGEGKKPSKGRDVKTYVRAPADGIVTFIQKAVGDSVTGYGQAQGDSSTEVINIADTRKIIARSRILEADLASVRVGMLAEVRLDAFRDKIYQGKISRISMQGVEDKAGGFTYFLTDVELINPDLDVRSQMNASLNIVVAERKGALTVPVTAVATLNGNSVMEVAPKSLDERDLKNRYRSVKIGIANETYVSIAEESVKEGEQFLEIDFADLNLEALGAGKLGKGRDDESSNGSKKQSKMKRGGPR